MHRLMAIPFESLALDKEKRARSRKAYRFFLGSGAGITLYKTAAMLGACSCAWPCLSNPAYGLSGSTPHLRCQKKMSQTNCLTHFLWLTTIEEVITAIKQDYAIA
jgi:hypothetical protein